MTTSCYDWIGLWTALASTAQFKRERLIAKMPKDTVALVVSIKPMLHMSGDNEVLCLFRGKMGWTYSGYLSLVQHA